MFFVFQFFLLYVYVNTQSLTQTSLFNVFVDIFFLICVFLSLYLGQVTSNDFQKLARLILKWYVIGSHL